MGRVEARRVYPLVEDDGAGIDVHPDEMMGRITGACSAATTKISERAVSMTGVEVIPTVGLMSPQRPGRWRG